MLCPLQSCSIQANEFVGNLFIIICKILLLMWSTIQIIQLLCGDVYRQIQYINSRCLHNYIGKSHQILQLKVGVYSNVFLLLSLFILCALQIQGAIILASLVQVLIGLTGVTGILLRFIGPLTIAPTITLIGISLFRTGANQCSAMWWIAIL